MRIGFTGSRTGLTAKQRDQLWALLPGALEFHHGDCIGADHEAHLIALELGVPVVVHPPTVVKYRAWSTHGMQYMAPAPFLVRNKRIVRYTDQLIACPKESVEPKPGRGQGTWSTVRYARDQGKPVDILWP
jgi:hypothetical protein